MLSDAQNILRNIPDKLLYYPGIESSELLIRKNQWIATLICCIAVSCIGITMVIADPGMTRSITYALVMVSIQLSLIIIAPFTRKSFLWLTVIANNLYILATFVTIIRLGGIPYSAGMIFVPFAVIFFTLPWQKLCVTTQLFILYVLTIIACVVLQPGLRDSGEFSPILNAVMFGVNIIWMSAAVYLSIVQYYNQNRKIDQMENQRLQELDEVKTRLFTNITHEFRTPLTIILGMADLVRQDPNRWLEEGSEKIKNSGHNLLHLVNQMLDLSKLKANAMPVHMQQGDIIIFLRYLTESFDSFAMQRRIDMHFMPVPQELMMDFDPDKVMHIVTNLISNAIKYSDEGGTVSIFADLISEENQLEIRVTDNGPGIPTEMLPFIFERFYRVETGIGKDSGGTGLGLALVKEMVLLLQGTIRVESNDKQGTAFVVRLPVTNLAPEKETLPSREFRDRIEAQQSKTGVTGSTEPQEREEHDLPVVLLVEDSSDVTVYLSALLERDYVILSAVNGRKGLDMALSNVPDIIISDVMMPVLDGISMLDMIKNDFRTSHIPVILLSAKADIESKLAGLERGADAYLAKPFNTVELLVTMKNLMMLRLKLHQRYRTDDLSLPKPEKPFDIEDKFMKKVRQLIDDNIDDHRFGIQELCLGTGMSRAQLYRKFRTLTDKPVKDYLRSYRLAKAREMLLAGRVNVSEAAFETGFQNLSHFSRIFTEEFGINPSEIGRSSS